MYRKSVIDPQNAGTRLLGQSFISRFPGYIPGMMISVECCTTGQVTVSTESTHHIAF